MPTRYSHRPLLWLLAGVALFRVAYVLIIRIDLAGDEAYYWDWGRRLDWGYYSKPPGIAWLMALVDKISSSSPLGFRIAPILIGTTSLALLYALTNAIASIGKDEPTRNPGLLAVLLALATPSNVALNLFLTIDSPLVLCWSAALLCFWNWTEHRHPTTALIGLTLALGLGNLSKQMMLIFPLLGIIYLISTPEKRPLLRRPGLYLAILTSLSFLAPPLIWNANHDWITFQHTSHHFDSGAGDQPLWQKIPEQFLTFVGTQMGALLSPITWLLAMTVAISGLLSYRQLSHRGAKYLIIFCGPALIIMHLMALRQTMQPNWPAVYYIATLALLACWLSSAITIPRVPLAWRNWTRPALILGLTLASAVYLLAPILRLTNHQGHKKLDPLRRTLGHAEVGTRAGESLAKAPQDAFIIALDHRYHASHFAFYLPGQPQVYRWERSGEIQSQYEIWPNPEEDGRLGQDAVIFLPRGRTLMRSFQKGFELVEKLDEFTIEISPHLSLSYDVYLGKNLLKWPDPPKK